jgi:hypothetical protein
MIRGVRMLHRIANGGPGQDVTDSPNATAGETCAPIDDDAVEARRWTPRRGLHDAGRCTNPPGPPLPALPPTVPASR